ncbi:right-handed parallel beta-helix repeat-containing protein [Cerasicoccus maritimus]|uniref:right-handed parallel beta-helix repeat-containing protein n=1 Tax=Cerasicoccus maritimus TaxID=490089 RepID=UPI0028527189|nr:right-handed parallel beta-helix repeat-containing protein [Cerasicoccus maritimus]
MNILILAQNLALRLSLAIALFAFFSGSVEAQHHSEILATDYGVSVDSADNTMALRRALKACDGLKGDRVLLLPEGKLRFSTEGLGGARSILEIVGSSDITLDGQGATLLIKGDPSNMKFFDVRDCKNLHFKNFRIDCELPMAAQGRILSFDGDGRIELEIDPKFPLPDGQHVESIVDCDPDEGLFLANIDLYSSAIKSITPLADNRYQVNFKKISSTENEDRFRDLHELESVMPGHRIVMRFYGYGGSAFHIINSDDVSFEDVTVHSFAGMGILASMSGDFSLNRFNVKPPEGSGRLISVTKDAVHLSHMRGKVKMNDCHFQAVGDDALNVYAKMRNVYRLIDSHTVEMIFDRNRGWQGPTPRKGEVLNFWRAESLEHIGKAQVTEAYWNSGAKRFLVKFSDPLPAGVSKRDWVSSELYLAEVEVSNCTFKGMLARAAVFSTNKVVFRDCEVEASSYSGILLTAGARHEMQGPAPRDVRIENNHFIGTGGAAIFGYIIVPRPSSSAMDQIVIRGNHFSEDVEMSKLRLKHRRPEWLHWSAAICLIGGSNFELSDNDFSGYQTSAVYDHVSRLKVEGNRSESTSRIVLNNGSGTFADDNENLSVDVGAEDIDWELRYLGITR